MSDANANKSDGDFSTRLREIMHMYGFASIAELARALGHERSENLSRVMRNPKARPGVEVVADLADKFDDLNITWFLTGKGKARQSMIPAVDAIREIGDNLKRLVPDLGIPRDMYPQEGSKGIPRGIPRGDLDTVSDPGVVRFVLHTPATVTVNEAGEPNIVMLDAQAAAGLPANLANPEFFAGKPAFRLPGYRYNNGTLVALQVMGDSMHPTIGHEDWLISRHLTDHKEVREGYVHVVVARDGVVAKRLFKAPGRTGFLCKSDNELYPPYELALEDILQLYKVEAVLSEDLSNDGADLRERLTRLERDVMALQARSNKR